jgi:hypothetical protein
MAPSAFYERQPLDVRVTRRHDDAADAVAVAVQVFRGAVHHQIGAELDGPLEDRAGKRVVDRQREATASASSLAASGSVSRMMGLVGVSTNSIFVEDESPAPRHSGRPCRDRKTTGCSG